MDNKNINKNTNKKIDKKRDKNINTEKTINKDTSNNIIRKIQLKDNNYVMLCVGLAILFLAVIFIYNEYYQSTKKKIKSDYTEEYEILLDSKNNEGRSYHFKQNFGSTRSGKLTSSRKYTIKHNNRLLEFDSNSDAKEYQKSNDLEYLNIKEKTIEVMSLDKKFDFLENEDCDNIETEMSIFMNIKFPYVYSNKGWKSSFKNMKPIIQIGNSPIIQYNPYNNYLEIGIAYKGKSVFKKMKYIRIENILLKKWLDFHFVIENRKIKIYQDKKLIKYEMLDSVPILNIDKSTIIKFGEYHNNFNGLVNKIIFYRKALTTSEIKNL